MTKDVQAASYNFRNSTKPKEAKSDKENRGELRCIRIEPAENGFTVTCSYEQAKSGPNAPYPDSPAYVFDDAEKAAAHVESLMVEHAGYEKKEK